MTLSDRRAPRLLAALLLLWGFIADTSAAPVAFTSVNVVPMDKERLLTDQTVVVEGGVIVALGKNGHVDIPENARRIEARGHYLMPGLYELHAHVPNTRAQTDRVLALFLANGVTSIRGMLGAPGHLNLRARLADGSRTGPRLITSGPSFNGRSVSNAEQARGMVQAQHEAGYDFLKLHPGLSRDEFDAIAEAADALSIPFAGHVSQDVGVHRALEAGQDCIDHLDGYIQGLVRDGVDPDEQPDSFFGIGLAPFVDDEKIAVLAKKTADAGVWNVATQTLIENFASATPGKELAARPHMRYMPVETVERWRQTKDSVLSASGYDPEVARAAVQIRRRLIKALHDAGAGLLLGSDAPQVFNVPGFAAHEELAVLVEAGLTPYEALRTGTTNPAVYFGEQDRRGLIRKGYAADLVLLARNPLKDIANAATIEGVMIAGQWHDRRQLDELLAAYDEQQHR